MFKQFLIIYIDIVNYKLKIEKIRLLNIYRSLILSFSPISKFKHSGVVWGSIVRLADLRFWCFLFIILESCWKLAELEFGQSFDIQATTFDHLTISTNKMLQTWRINLMGARACICEEKKNSFEHHNFYFTINCDMHGGLTEAFYSLLYICKYLQHLIICNL